MKSPKSGEKGMCQLIVGKIPFFQEILYVLWSAALSKKEALRPLRYRKPFIMAACSTLIRSCLAMILSAWS